MVKQQSFDRNIDIMYILVLDHNHVQIFQQIPLVLSTCCKQINLFHQQLIGSNYFELKKIFIEEIGRKKVLQMALKQNICNMSGFSCECLWFTNMKCVNIFLINSTVTYLNSFNKNLYNKNRPEQYLSHNPPIQFYD